MRNKRSFLLFGLACGLVVLAGMLHPSRAASEHGHLHHQHADTAPGYGRQVAQYRLPAAQLVRSDGSKASFPEVLDDGRPVVLNFIYTTCTAICPILSQSFSEFQRRLGAERAGVHMVSISIDPEQDTPRRLADYAARFEAGPQWDFLTGSAAASVSLQKAFQAYFGDKMHHRPVSFLRAAPGQPWVRLEGFTTPDELLAEYRRLVAQH
jgi:protein SCO1/2